MMKRDDPAYWHKPREEYRYNACPRCGGELTYHMGWHQYHCKDDLDCQWFINDPDYHTAKKRVRWPLLHKLGQLGAWVIVVPILFIYLVLTVSASLGISNTAIAVAVTIFLIFLILGGSEKEESKNG